MSKYVGGHEYRNPRVRTSDLIAKNLTQGLEKFAETLALKQREEEDQKIFNELDDPNLTPVQKANLAARLSQKGQFALSQYLKMQGKMMHEEEVRLRELENAQYRKNKEDRLRNQYQAQDITRIYKTRLDDLKDQIANTFNRDEKKLLQDDKKALERELGRNLNRIRKGEEPHFDLIGIEETPIPAQKLPVEGVNQLGGMQAAQFSQNQMNPINESLGAQTQQPNKMVWNPQDPEHQEMARQALQRAQGDRALANQLIGEMFQR